MTATALLFALPLIAALPLALSEALDRSAWHALWADPQLPRALGASVFTALASTLGAIALTLWLVTHLHATPAWARLTAALGPMLALPHAAFAIGLAWLIAPAGALARLIAPLAGWSAPPDWVTVNDPHGLALVAVLLLKELPFLLWSALALLSRPEVVASLRAQVALARTLGYAPHAWWWRVGWLQWAPRLVWPALAVLAYGLTVVDLALIVGPGSPPTLAVLAWQGLSDGNVARNAQGAAAALLLTGVLVMLVAAGFVVMAGLQRWGRRRVARGVRGRGFEGRRPLAARATVGSVATVYAGVVLALGVLSVAGVWTFPALWPQGVSGAAWAQVVQSASTVGFTAALAAAASAGGVLLSMAWLEAAPPRWDRRITPLVLAPLVLPQLLLMVGMYRGALALQLDGTVLGLWWVHTLMALPYSFTALAPAWRSFDRRYEWSALTLGRRRLAFWWRVKWPLLSGPLASALAIGFAVSVAQYLATQFIGAGRHATLTTEAVALASGGQRTLAAAFALLQALLPALAFALAAWAQRRPTMQP